MKPSAGKLPGDSFIKIKHPAEWLDVLFSSSGA
jgi:hypothetical protein